MSHELHKSRCASEVSFRGEDIMDMIKTGTSSLAAIITPPTSPIRSDRNAAVKSPMRVHWAGAQSRAASFHFPLKTMATESMCWVVRVSFSMIMWAAMLLFGGVVTLVAIVITSDLAQAGILLEDYD
jgi:hypothetical protein